MANPLAKLPGLVAKHLGPIMSDASLIKLAGHTSDGRGGRKPSGTYTYPCRAIVTDYSDYQRGLSGGAIEIDDRKAVVVAQSLSVVPKVGDHFSLGGNWALLGVKGDPASATYELHLRPATTGDLASDPENTPDVEIDFGDGFFIAWE